MTLLMLATQFATGVTETRAADIVVSWVTVEHEVRPRQGVWRANRSVRLNLQGGNAIAETRSVTNMSGRTSTLNTGGRFREQMKGGKTVQSSWRVQDAKTLVRTESRPQHSETIRVSLDSPHTCRAAISYRLKHGFREYRMQSITLRAPIYLASLSAEQVTCRVTPGG